MSWRNHAQAADPQSERLISLEGSPGSVEANDLRVTMGTPSVAQGDFSTARPQQPDGAPSKKGASKRKLFRKLFRESFWKLFRKLF